MTKTRCAIEIANRPLPSKLAKYLTVVAKAAFKDIDLTEGRSLRKRAAAPSSGPKKSAPKKAAKVGECGLFKTVISAMHSCKIKRFQIKVLKVKDEIFIILK